MKYFILYFLYWILGCFGLATILYLVDNSSVAISFVVGGIWGYIVAKDAIERFM